MATQQITYGSDYDTERQRIARQRKLADALMMQANSQIDPNRMAGGWVVPIARTEGLAKLAQGLSGGLMQNYADKRDAELGAKMRQDRSDTLQKFADALKGTPARAAIEAPPDELGGGPARAAISAQPGNPTAAYGALMQSQDPALQQMGMKGIVDSSKPIVLGRSLVTPGGQTLAVDQTWRAEQQASREAKVDEQQALRQQRMDELQMRIAAQEKAGQDSAALRRELQAQQLQAREEMVRLAASLRPPPAAAQPQVIQTEQGTFVIDKPGASARPVTAPDGSPLMGKSEKPMTEFQGKSALYGTRAASSHNTLNSLEDEISTTGLAVKRGLENMPLVGGALGAAGNLVLSKDQQRVEQAQRDFVNAVLRQESGAVISDNEFKNAQRQYFPVPGDSQEVIQQKRANREMAIAGFERMSGREGAAAINDVRNNQPLKPRGQDRRQTDRRIPAAPSGVNPAEWAAMSPEDRALWK